MLQYKFISYGLLGLLIEVIFTGVYSLFQRHWKATGVTYLPMFFVYGVAGMALEALSESIAWPVPTKALIYVIVIYGTEALSGFLLMKSTGWLQRKFGGTGGGVVPWEYAKSKFAPMGLVNFKYLPYWYGLALVFDPISSFLKKAIVLLVGAWY